MLILLWSKLKFKKEKWSLSHLITFSSSRTNGYICFIKDRHRSKQSVRSRQKQKKNKGRFLEITNINQYYQREQNNKQTKKYRLGTFSTLRKPLGSGKPTTVKFFWCNCGHWSSLDSSWILTGSCCLSITRLCICLQQLCQPQDFTVTMKSIWIQTPAKNIKQPHHLSATFRLFC